MSNSIRAHSVPVGCAKLSIPAPGSITLNPNVTLKCSSLSAKRGSVPRAQTSIACRHLRWPRLWRSRFVWRQRAAGGKLFSLTASWCHQTWFREARASPMPAKRAANTLCQIYSRAQAQLLPRSPTIRHIAFHGLSRNWHSRNLHGGRRLERRGDQVCQVGNRDGIRRSHVVRPARLAAKQDRPQPNRHVGGVEV